MTRDATVNLEAAGAAAWDCVVAGAGPAGSLAARELARRGKRVLLVDRATFPRAKVCGCCLNGVALDTLAACGLSDLPGLRRGVPLRALALAARGTDLRLDLPPGLALSRTVLDVELIRAAIAAGVSFLPATTATLLPGNGADERAIDLRRGARAVRIGTRIAIAADGLGGRFLANEPAFRIVEARDARVGVAATIMTGPDAYPPGVIHMATAAGGYVGLVRLEDGALNIAAALDIEYRRRCPDVTAAVRQILTAAGWPEPANLATARWHGTARLTRRREPAAAGRVFAIGDAAGYVEPFTGEGMAFALAGAVAVAPLAEAAIERWDPDLGRAWSRRYRELFAARQRSCRVLTRALRRPWLTALAGGVLARMPLLARPYLGRLNRMPSVAAGPPRS